MMANSSFPKPMCFAFTKDEDREEVRSILRCMMWEDDDKEEENDILREWEKDAVSHVANYHFLMGELDWIKKHYPHLRNFV